MPAWQSIILRNLMLVLNRIITQQVILIMYIHQYHYYMPNMQDKWQIQHNCHTPHFLAISILLNIDDWYKKATFFIKSSKIAYKYTLHNHTF